MSAAAPVTLHRELDGDPAAPPLLLGSSLGATAAMWAPQLPALAVGRRVIRFDHRGHGRSPRPPGPYALADLGRDVVALLDDLEIARADFCGLSLGGMVGMWLAAHAPERVGRLVLICTSAHLPPAARWRDRAAAVRAAGTVEAVADAVVARWLTPAFAAAHPTLRARLREQLAAAPPAGYAACCEAIAAMDLRDALPLIASPPLVIAGAEDRATPPAHGRAIAAAVRDAHLETLSPMAHLGNVEQPGAVTRLIREFLDRSEAP